MIPFIRAALAQNVTVPSSPGQADGRFLGGGIVPECATRPGGPTAADGLDCVLQLFINIADILVGLVGGILLIVVVWAGILYLTSAGDPGKVKKATQMMLSSIVGLLIVFGAFSGVQYGINVLRGGDSSSTNSATFVTCGSEANPINDGSACGPGFICQAGVCVDLVEKIIK